jgi:hypothetical protein
LVVVKVEPMADSTVLLTVELTDELTAEKLVRRLVAATAVKKVVQRDKQ